MSKITKHILMGGLLLSAATVWASDPTLKVYDVDVTVNEQTHTLTMVLDLHMKDFKIGRNGDAIYTPIIFSENGQDSVVMSPFTVCGRNRYYYYLREGFLDTGTAPIYRSGSKETVTITETVPLERWMTNNGTVEVRQQKTNCCSAPTLVPGNSEWGNVLIARINEPLPTREFDYVFSPPMEDEPVKKSVQGRAFVTFVVNRTELNPHYMINTQELRKITNSIDIVKADPDAIITEIHIRGYASPEGPYDNNVRLAKGRTQTLANYVNSLYKFKPGIMTTSYDPEDWAGLRSYVTDSMDFPLKNRLGLLAIIDGPLGFDARDAALKSQFPQDYEIILRDIYPWLRHSDYTVNYNIQVYTDLANLMRLYNTDPTKLRPVDFYTIAQEYPVGSPEYLAVMKKAVEVYPDHPMINLNVANIYLMDGDFDAAQSCLLKAGQNPGANYARGVLAAKRDDYREAIKWFTLAEEEGVAQAGKAIELVKQAQTAANVKILVPTTKKD